MDKIKNFLSKINVPGFDKAKNFVYAHKFKLLIAGILLCLLIGLEVDNRTNSSISANFADDVLRPMIGDQATIFLETIFFNIQDKVTQIEYMIIKPSSSSSEFTNGDSSVIAESKTMDLSPINLEDNNFPKLSGEGIWKLVPLNQFPNQTVMADTFVIPDSTRLYAIASIIKIDMSKLNLAAVAGTKEPGGAFGHFGPGKVPINIQTDNSLTAAFNGGFQEKDGQYGMIVGNQTYLPLKLGLATLVIDKNSKLSIVKYMGQDLGSDNQAIRQNGDMLVENSQVVANPDDDQFTVWGRTVTKSMYTWRSGIGITKEGDLIYAVGPSLIPETLAKALLSAGAVDAMQLDINPYWVRFVIFNPLGSGQYTHYSLIKNMYDGGKNFLNGYQKDFFYLYKK